ncbi:lipopolysaccharide N-acetylglucosaminyltransferase [Vagococcus sp. WN89Y]|uniref:lipopolysaccharide N-acetylglucosaminyltransferase n=1 Tax=Vagococcus sp. WN89Y TaxID=3457258 RepID=UPI003FCDD81D
MIKKIVLTVTPIFSIPPKGAAAVESWMYNVAQRLAYKNKIVCIKNEGYSDFSEVNKNCSIHRIGFSRVYKRLFQKWTRLDPLPYSQRIINIKKQFASDAESVIVIHNSLKLYRQIRHRAPDSNVVLHMHNAFEPKNIGADAKIIVPSNYLKAYYQSYLPSANIEVIPNGIDLAYYNSAEKKLSRAQLGINEKDITIFYAGRIVPDKGVLLLLQAYEKIAKKRDNVKLIIVGDAYSSSKGEIAEYQSEVRSIAEKFPTSCIMLGSVAPEEMHHYYPLADLVVIPSQFKEPFCMVAIEAMGAGRPVLVSTRGGMTEFVKEHQTGFHLSEPMTPESIVHDIETVLNEPSLGQVALQGQKYVFDHFSWEAVTVAFESLIQKWFD